MILTEYNETRNPLGCRLNQHYLTDGKKNYFFKGINSDDEIIKIVRELLASEVLDILNISHIKYKYYIWEGMRGTLSENFLDNGYEVMSGLDLITKYQEVVNENSQELYNLYSIWEAMDYYFQSYPNFNEQIKLFMNNIIDMCLFDFLIVNSDRNATNFNIIFNSKEFRLGPLFDHNLAYEKSMSSHLNTITSKYNISNRISLNILLNESDERVFKRLVEFLSVINPRVISKLLTKVIEENALPMNNEAKYEIIRVFEKNYRIIMQCALNHNRIYNNENISSTELVKRYKR